MLFSRPAVARERPVHIVHGLKTTSPTPSRPAHHPSSHNGQYIYRHEDPRLGDQVGTPTTAWPLTQKQALTAAWWRSITKNSPAAAHEDIDHLRLPVAIMEQPPTARGSFKRYRRRYVLAPAQRARDLGQDEVGPVQDQFEVAAALRHQRRQGKGKDEGKGKGKHARRYLPLSGKREVQTLAPVQEGLCAGNPS